MSKKAFTYLEILVVITIMMIAMGFYALYAQTDQVRADINSQANILVSHLRLAQSDAAMGKNSSDHGIHLESDSYTIFIGSSYDPAASSNFTTALPDTISIENIALNGAGQDIVFLQPNGETNTYGSFDLTSEQISKIISITIGQLGNVEY